MLFFTAAILLCAVRDAQCKNQYVRLRDQRHLVMVVDYQVFVYLSFTLIYILIFNNLQIQYFPSFQKFKYPFPVCLFLY